MEHDPVNHPSHYMGNGMESIEVIESFHFGFHLGNVFKYLVRHKSKNGMEDVKKALWYLKRFYENRDIKETQIRIWYNEQEPSQIKYLETIQAFKILDKTFTHLNISFVMVELLYLQVKCDSVNLLDELLAAMIDRLESYTNGL